MPEGPEVKTITDYLNTTFKHATLTNIKIHSGRYAKRPEGRPTSLAKTPFTIPKLPLVLQSVGCKGKFIYFKFENDVSLWVTLGLTGWFETDPELKHNNVEFIFNTQNIFFNDPRNFGTLKFNNSPKELDRKIKSLGLDLLNEDITKEQFLEKIRHYDNKDLASVLLNQKLFAGVGNYLRSDSLYLSKLSPFKKIKERTDKQLVKLYKVLKKLMVSNVGFRYGVNDFIIYKKKEDAHGNKVINVQDKNKRTIHWVKDVQVQ